MFVQYGDWFEDRRNLDVCKDCWEHIGLCTRRIVDRDGKAAKEQEYNPLLDVHTVTIKSDYEDWASRSELARKMSESVERNFKSLTNTSYFGDCQPRSEVDPYLAKKQPHRINPESLRIEYDLDGTPRLYYATYNGIRYMQKLPDAHKI